MSSYRPANLGKSPYARDADVKAFGAKELAFDLQAAAVAAKAATCADDAVAGNACVAALAHDGADGTRRPRRSGQFRDVAVGRHSSRGNAPDDREHAPLKFATGQRQT